MMPTGSPLHCTALGLAGADSERCATATLDVFHTPALYPLHRASSCKDRIRWQSYSTALKYGVWRPLPCIPSNLHTHFCPPSQFELILRLHLVPCLERCMDMSPPLAGIHPARASHTHPQAACAASFFHRLTPSPNMRRTRVSCCDTNGSDLPDAQHLQSLSPIPHDLVLTFSRATSNFCAVSPQFKASACHTPPRCAPPATCATCHLRLLHARQVSSVLSRSHHLTGVPGR
jgi:hypothetical protein